METALLLKKISKPISKKEAVDLGSQNGHSVNELIKLSLHSNHEVAFRAAWVLELIAFGQPRHFYKLLPEFIDAYIILKNESSQRHFTKILMDLTLPKNIAQQLSDIDLDPIIETTFEWMIDLKTPVAVKVNCMDILYNLRDRSDWVADELGAQIEFQLRQGSAALQSRGKKILYKLSKRR